MSSCDLEPRRQRLRLLTLTSAQLFEKRSAASFPHDLIRLDTPDDLLSHLEHRPVDGLLVDKVLLADPRTIEEAKRLRPETRIIFLTDDSTSAALKKLATKGHDIVSIPSTQRPDSLATTLEAIFFPRTHVRQPFDHLTVSFQQSGLDQLRTYPVSDISNHGLAWFIPTNDPQGPLFPGNQVMELQVRSGRRTVLEVSRAIVRHLGCVRESEKDPLPTRYRVGVAFLGPTDSPDAHELIREPAKIASLLQHAVQLDGIRLSPPFQPDLSRTSDVGSLGDASAKDIVVRGQWPDDWTNATVLRGSFDTAGWGYEFITSVREHLPMAPSSLGQAGAAPALVLYRPSVLKTVRRRTAARYRPPEAAPIEATLRTPFTKQPIMGRVTDICGFGVAVLLDGNDVLLPVGTRIDEVTLRGLAPRVLRANGVVCALRRADQDDEGACLCGLRLEWPDQAERVAATDALLAQNTPDLSSGQGLQFDELWSFFVRANLVYPQKEQNLRPIFGDMKRNVTQLLASPIPLVMKTVVFKDSGKVYGHQSLLRAYQNTWIVQHLSSDLKGKRRLFAARDANIGITDHVLHTPEVNWIRTYYQPGKSFPDRVIGGFARKVHGHECSDLREHSYLMARCLANGNPPTSGEVSIRSWEPDDIETIRGYFVDRGRLLELRADDITREQIELPAVSAAYAEAGLERWREVFVAEKRGQRVGFALLEFSSLGLNLSDITNHATICAWENAPAVASALASATLDRCRELGRSYSIVLCPHEEAEWYGAVGYAKQREYACWTSHRSLGPDYRDHVVRLLGRGRPIGGIR